MAKQLTDERAAQVKAQILERKRARELVRLKQGAQTANILKRFKKTELVTHSRINAGPYVCGCP
jgi:hypothetical protein